MMKLLITEDAENHLEEVYDYLADKSQQIAANLYNDLLDGIELLTGQPQLGRIEPLLENLAISYRSLVLYDYYKIIYHIDNETIVVVAIYNCLQDPVKLLDILQEK